MTAYIRSTQPAKRWPGARRYVVTLSQRKHKRLNIGTVHSPLAAALLAARAELSITTAAAVRKQKHRP